MNRLALTICTVLFIGCSGESQEVLNAGLDSISESDLAMHIEKLASDEFEGRAPSSPGEVITIEYLASEFERMGVQPGNGESYFQDVPLVDITAASSADLTIQGVDGTENWKYGDDFVTWTTRVVDESHVSESDLVFVGYGIVAPEFDWDDYRDIDVAGKTVLILVNDPGFATQNPELFNGNSMTYYGRWTYKFEEAARQGAAAALIVHQTEPAAYGWNLVRSSWTGPQFSLRSEDGNADRLDLEGWVTESVAEDIFESAGLELEQIQSEAKESGFKAIDLERSVSASVINTLRNSDSRNVIGILPGTEAPDEYFIYMAHWDHLGTDPELEARGEDGIKNGALDNASGTAALLELAEAFASQPQSMRRTIIFLATTAEEQGLLGSSYYAENPIFPLSQTVAGLNMDGLSNFGPTHDIMVMGLGQSELDQILERAANLQNRRVDADPEPEAGYYFRSDHFELAKRGVPMIYPGPGIDHIEHGPEWGQAQNDKYVEERYHQPSDEFDDSWDLSGAVADVQLYFSVGAVVAGSDEWPKWSPNSEFRAIRESSLK